MSDNESAREFDRNYWTRGFAQPATTFFYRDICVKILCIAYLSLVRLLHHALSCWPHNKKSDTRRTEKISVLAIGPFFSENWSLAHMEALCKADEVNHVYLFTPAAYKQVGKLHYVTHSPRVAAWFGGGIARMLNAWRLALKVRPDLIIGYHLPWNGLIALLIAARVEAKAIYFSVGGPPEVIGGGIYSEHALFSKLAREDAHIERLFVDLLGKFDGILTMGTRSQAYFLEYLETMPVVPMAVGINDSRFSSHSRLARSAMDFELVSVGRLTAIKKTDVLLHIVAQLADKGTIVRAAIVGDGEEMDNLTILARELGVSDKVQFFGWINDVEEVLNRSKIFVMTSASEGLPHSLIEAMLTSMPVVVPEIGEISDLVEDGLNGYLVPGHDLNRYVRCIDNLLASPQVIAKLGIHARNAALRYSVDSRVNVWNDTLSRFSGH